MKLLFISSLLVAATNAADVDRRRINGITFADQAVEALNLVHKGQASQASSSTVLIKKGESDNKGGNKGGDDKSSRNDKSSNDKKSSNSNSSSSESSGSRSSSRDGRGVCGESDDYCKNYDSSSFLNIKKEDGGNKGGDDKNKSSRGDNKSSGSSKSNSSSSTGSSRDGGRRTDRCFRACDTDRCTSDDRRRLACPDSTAASSDMKFVQKGQASPIQKLVWAAKGEDEGGDDPASKTSKDNDSPDDKSDDKDNSDEKDKSSKSSSSTGSSDNDRKWSGSGDDICKDAPKDWCEGSSADGDDDCDDACDNCDEEERKHLGCDETSKDVAATKKLRRRKA